MHKILSVILGVALAGSASAQLDETLLKPWSEVQAVLDAPDTLKYDSPYQAYWLARDGRLVVRSAQPEEEIAMEPAGLGSWQSDGAWVTLMQTHEAYPSQAALAQARKAWDDYRAELEASAETEEQQAELAELLAESDAAAEAGAQGDEDAEPEGFRLLRVPYGAGEVLVAEWSLKSMAAAWDGKGPLLLMPSAWRLPAGQVPESIDGVPRFEIVNPLAAGLPIELAGMLRRDAIHGSVVDVLDTPDTLKWEAHNAVVRLKLDRGANHGLYKDMDLYGLPPDEGFFAQVVELQGEEAVAELHISRFAPADAPDLPARGLRFTTRREGDSGCHLDTSAALRAKVLTVATPPKRVRWDEDGFAFVELTIDQGARHGLLAGDGFGAEVDDIDGEGRVERVEAERATVLWRAQRYGEEHEVRWPAAGDALVTPAWQREAYDAFGSDAAE